MIQEGDKVPILRLTDIILEKGVLCGKTWSLYKVIVNYGLFCPICSKCYVRPLLGMIPEERQGKGREKIDLRQGLPKSRVSLT